MSRKADIKRLIRGAPAPNTAKAYERDVAYFWEWAKVAAGVKRRRYPVKQKLLEQFVEEHVVGLDPDVNDALIRTKVKRKHGNLRVDTVRRRLVGVIRENQMRGYDTQNTPRMRAMLRGAKRLESQSGLQKRKARAITVDMLDRMIKAYGPARTLKAKRDIAMLVFAFYTGGRRSSEVRDARFENLYKFKGGYRYFLHRSKTDQVGKGQEKILRYPHSKHMQRWLRAAKIKNGYLFRQISINGKRVLDAPIGTHLLSRIVKWRMDDLGEDPALFSAHSLRRGFLTQCGKDNVPLSEAMQCSGHKNVVIAMEYYEQGQIDKNAGTKINTRRR